MGCCLCLPENASSPPLAGAASQRFASTSHSHRIQEQRPTTTPASARCWSARPTLWVCSSQPSEVPGTSLTRLSCLTWAPSNRQCAAVRRPLFFPAGRPPPSHRSISPLLLLYTLTLPCLSHKRLLFLPLSLPHIINPPSIGSQNRCIRTGRRLDPLNCHSSRNHIYATSSRQDTWSLLTSPTRRATTQNHPNQPSIIPRPTRRVGL